jgi:gliding motility-associatede transport system auxiliary component
VRKSASIFGLLGLLFLAFGFVATAFVSSPASDPYVLLNVVLGAVLLVIYLVFGLENLRTLVGSRSTRYGASAAIYSLLFVALVVSLNYLGIRHHKQWDVTEASVYTLSPQSKKVADALTDTLVLTAFTDGGTNPQLQTVLDGYRDAAPGKVETRMLDPDKEPSLAEQMKITTVPSVNIQFGKESFVVTQPSEETITNGIIRVTRPGKKLVYFTEGFGEASFQDPQDPKGFASAKLALEQENYEVKPLLLPSVEQVPDDASVVVLAGPTRPLTDAAIAALEAYLKRGGHLLALVGPRIGGGKLGAFLATWGVKVGDDIVIDREVRLFEGPRLGVVPLSRTYGTHPITQGFRDFTVYPQTASVEPAAEGKKGLQATSLVKTSESSWAESDIDGVFVQGVATLDDKDHKGPVSIAVAVTANLKDMGFAPPEGVTDARLVVVGTPLFIDNQQLAQAQLNGDLFLNAVGWLVGQGELVSIRSRSVRASRADLTPAQAARVFYLSVFIIPELLIALGIWVWWRRRTA